MRTMVYFAQESANKAELVRVSSFLLHRASAGLETGGSAIKVTLTWPVSRGWLSSESSVGTVGRSLISPPKGSFLTAW